MGTLNEISLKNQYGEQSINQIVSVSEEAGDATVDAATNATVTGKVLTGLAAGAATTILATDTILEAFAKLQAQIDAL